jgi:hypothetical protein
MTMRRMTTRRAAAAAALLAAAVAVPVFALEVSELSMERLAQPFLGGTSVPPLAPADTAELDHLGNFNGRYDIGDVRLFLYNNPQLIPEEQVVLP